MITIDSEKMVRKLYGVLLDEIAETQAELVKIHHLELMFGPKALPPDRLARRMNTRTLREAPDTLARSKQRLSQRLEENYQLVSTLEELFASKDEMEMEIFIAAMRERFKAAVEEEQGSQRAR